MPTPTRNRPCPPRPGPASAAPLFAASRYASRFVARIAVLLAVLLTVLLPAPARAAAEIRVNNLQALHAAVRQVNETRTPATIVLADGTYRLRDTLGFTVPGVTLRSAGGDPRKVIIEGDRMAEDASIGNLVWIAASDFTLSGITLRRAGRHLVQVAGEYDTDRVVFENCILQDAWQQLFKVSRDTARPHVFADDGRIEGCEFGYSAGIAPQYYVGGIDAHGARNWLVRNNLFRDIASPSREIAQYAVHFWSDSADNVIEQNIIIDCDRGIGFGLRGRPHSGGIIRNNLIVHTDNGDPFADTGIALIDATGATVRGNQIYFAHDYPWSIEHRALGTRGAVIEDNVSNRPIQPVSGGDARLAGNRTDRSVPVPSQWKKP